MFHYMRYLFCRISDDNIEYIQYNIKHNIEDKKNNTTLFFLFFVMTKSHSKIRQSVRVIYAHILKKRILIPYLNTILVDEHL